MEYENHQNTEQSAFGGRQNDSNIMRKNKRND